MSFVPSNAAELARNSARSLRAVAELLDLILEDLPDDGREDLVALLVGGGRLGLEFTVDRAGKTTIALIAAEREGAHRTLATVTPGGSSTAH